MNWLNNWAQKLTLHTQNHLQIQNYERQNGCLLW